MPVISALCEYKKVKLLSIKCGVVCAEKKRRPVVVHIHGGALVGGSRNGYSRGLRKLLLKAGFSFVTIDYRLAPQTKLPEIIADVRDALDWTRCEGAETFGWDGARMGVTGGSAGGYLTLMTGTFESKPNALAPFYGYGDILGDWYCKPDPFYNTFAKVTETEAFSKTGGGERTGGGCGDFYLYARQTGTWTGHVSGLDVERDKEKIIPYCPALVASNDYPPTLLIHGDADTDVPHSQSAQMHEALVKAGVESKFISLPGYPHGFDFQMPKDPETQRANKAVADFFLKKL